jgi:hypothetical protein
VKESLMKNAGRYLLALAVCLTPACFDQAGCMTQQQIIGPTPVSSPSPSPSPTASPSGGQKTTDVSGFGQFFYGIHQNPVSVGVCPPGLTEAIKHVDSFADFTVPAGCDAAITATIFSDKDANGDGKPDGALDPSRDLKWKISGPGRLDPGLDGETLFNQVLVPLGTGVATVTSTFIDSAGGLHEATKTYSLHG